MDAKNYSNCSLLELLDEGNRILAENKARDKVEQKLAEELEEHRRVTVLADIRALLPRSIGKFVVFEAWHKPNYEMHATWDATCMIQLPEGAPIIIYVDVRGDPHEPTGVLWQRNHPVYPFELICDFRVNEFDGEVYIQNGISEGYSLEDLPIALARSLAVGDIYTEAQLRKDELEKKLKEKQQSVSGQEELKPLSLEQELYRIIRSIVRNEIEGG